MKILLIKHGALGDVVRTSYLLQSLHEFAQTQEQSAQNSRARHFSGDFPQKLELDIYWLTAPAAADLLRFHPLIHSLHTSASSLLTIEFDWVISLDDEQDAVEIASSVRAKKRSGAFLFDGERSYTEDVALWFEMGLLSKLGKARADELKKINTLGHAEIFAKMFALSPLQASFFGDRLREDFWWAQRRVGYFQVGLNPYAGARWTSKALPSEELLTLLQALTRAQINDLPLQLTLFAEGAQREEIREITKKMPRTRVADTSNSVLSFAAAVRVQDYLISSDSLALHLAISQNVPTLSFYAPTSAAEIDTFGRGVKVISTSADYCSYRRDADNRSVTAARLQSAMQAHLVQLGHHIEWD